MIFEVEFLDGHTASMTANAIAENLFSQVDSGCRRLLLLDEIIHHGTRDKVVKKPDRKGKKPSAYTSTKGWEFLVRWKDGSETWTTLKDIKESFIVQVAEYAVRTQIDDEPAFAWWVPHVMRKRDKIIAQVKTKYWQSTHKYGIEIPKSVAEAKRLDERNGNTLWWDAICQEMANVRVAFEEYNGEGTPMGYARINCHIIFDVKLGENFRRKARLVAQGNRTEDPEVLTFSSSVVSRDSVRICLLIAALNGLDLKACDIKNAYLTVPNKERVYVVAGPEFGPELQGKVLIVVKALYGLKSAGAAFRSYLVAEHLWSLDYRPSYADPDVWLRPAVKSNGFEYYEMKSP